MHPELQFGTPDFARMRVPASLCPRTGLSRSAYDKLVRPQPSNDFRPPVKSKLLKQQGGRLIRLVDYRSLLDYLRSLPDGTDPENIVASDAKRTKAETPALSK